MDVAVVEAGLGGRLDATNVVDARGRPAHERRARAHRGARRDARGDRAGETRSCACGKSSCHVGQHASNRSWRPTSQIVIGGAREAAEAFLERPIEHDVEVVAARAARAARRRDPRRSAHTRSSRLAARAHPGPRLRPLRLDPRDKRVDELLEGSGARSARSSRRARANPRALPAKRARRARGATSRARRSRRRIRERALARARAFGAPSSSPARSTCSRTSTRERKNGAGRRKLANGSASSRSPAVVVLTIVGLAFAAGYVVGQLLL